MELRPNGPVGMLLLGQRQDAPALLAAADLSVHPAHEDGLSNALPEAMTCGLAVVGLDVEGTRDLLGRAEGGRLLPPETRTL
ncbi:MAG: glycosyltransferase [Candidatus Methylomirabilales bacterium]